MSASSLLGSLRRTHSDAYGFDLPASSSSLHADADAFFRREEDERFDAWNLLLDEYDLDVRRAVSRVQACCCSSRTNSSELGDGDEDDDDDDDNNADLTLLAQMRSLVTAGVPMALRRDAWRAFLNVNNDGVGDYETHLAAANEEAARILEERRLFLAASASKVKDPSAPTHGHGGHWAVQIEKDIPRTANFERQPLIANDVALNMLRNILRAHARKNLHVGYSQGLNFVASVLLLVLDEEEDAFYALCRLTEDRLKGFWDTSDDGSLLAATEDSDLLSALVEMHLPTVHRRLHALGHDLRALSLSWLLCLWVNSLPWQTVLRIWDVIFFEPTADAARGMILRVCLALLDLNADVVVNAGDGAEASMALRSRVAQHEDATTLLVCACARRGSLADLQREVATMSKSGVVSVSMSPLPVSFGPGDDTATDVQHMN